MDLPRGREHVHHRGHDYTLRGSESRTLSAVGAFRVIPANDLHDTFDKPLDPRHGGLWHLREAKLVQTVRIDRDHDRSLAEARELADEHHLPCDDRGVVMFPDARIEYELDGTIHARRRGDDGPLPGAHRPR